MCVLVSLLHKRAQEVRDLKMRQLGGWLFGSLYTSIVILQLFLQLFFCYQPQIVCVVSPFTTAAVPMNCLRLILHSHIKHTLIFPMLLLQN